MKAPIQNMFENIGCCFTFFIYDVGDMLMNIGHYYSTP